MLSFSFLEPVLYPTNTATSGAEWFSLIKTFKPLSRTVSCIPSASAIKGKIHRSVKIINFFIVLLLLPLRFV